MTAQPDMTGFGRPPGAPTGLRRIAPLVSTAATGGFVVMLGIYGLQIFAPEHYKPGYILGTTVGSETKGHLDTSGDAQIDFETRQQAAQQALAATTNSMTGLAGIASIADGLCGASVMGKNFAGSQHRPFDTNSDAAWWEGLFRDVGNATCGVGAQVRSGMIAEVTGNGRQSATLSARERVAPSPAPATQHAVYRSLEEIYDIHLPSRPYSWEERDKARFYTFKLPLDVRERLYRNLIDENIGPDILTERVNAYIAFVATH